jgi:hypothetical protein
MQVRPDGKILLAGSNTTFLSGHSAQLAALARLTADGALDTTFSGDGRQQYSFTQNALAIAAAPKGKTFMAGLNSAGVLSVARFQADAAATASIGGAVYDDTNGSGSRDSGEIGLANWQVYIDANNDGFYTPGETVATTDSSGNYKISGLLPGTYRIREVRLSDWNRTQPAGTYPLGYYDITLGVGQAVTGKNFGNKHV